MADELGRVGLLNQVAVDPAGTACVTPIGLAHPAFADPPRLIARTAGAPRRPRLFHQGVVELNMRYMACPSARTSGSSSALQAS